MKNEGVQYSILKTDNTKRPRKIEISATTYKEYLKLVFKRIIRT